MEELTILCSSPQSHSRTTLLRKVLSHKVRKVSLKSVGRTETSEPGAHPPGAS